MDPIRRATDNNVTKAVLSTERDGRRQGVIDPQTEKGVQNSVPSFKNRMKTFQRRSVKGMPKGY